VPTSRKSRYSGPFRLVRLGSADSLTVAARKRNHSREFLGQPAFSPNGHWLAYVSRESGRFEVFVASFPAGHGKYEVSIQGGTQPVWRQDGKELFYLSQDGTLMAVPVKIGASFEAGTPQLLFKIRTRGLRQYRREYDVSPDGQRFLVNVLPEKPPQNPVILLQNWLHQ